MDLREGFDQFLSEMDSYVEPADTTIQPRRLTSEDQPCSSAFGEVSEQSPIPISQLNKASYPQHSACSSEKVAAMKPSMSIVGGASSSLHQIRSSALMPQSNVNDGDLQKRTGTINSTHQRKRSKQSEEFSDAEHPD